VSTSKIEFEEGKYTVLHEDGLNARALRYGEAWRDFTGDKLMSHMVLEITGLRAQSAQLLQALKETQGALDVSQCPWCGGWGPEYRDSDQPLTYCHHEYTLRPWQMFAPLQPDGLPLPVTPQPEAAALTVIDHGAWEPCSPGWLMRGGKCADAPRLWHAATGNHWHPKIAAPQPVATP
jgi:hypothetical protein